MCLLIIYLIYIFIYHNYLFVIYLFIYYKYLSIIILFIIYYIFIIYAYKYKYVYHFILYDYSVQFVDPFRVGGHQKGSIASGVRDMRTCSSATVAITPRQRHDLGTRMRAEIAKPNHDKPGNRRMNCLGENTFCFCGPQK